MHNRILNFIKRLYILFLDNNSRTGKVFKNFTISALFKVISIGISFMLVPLSLSYLDRSGYGLWSAISSVITWFFIFDIGIGNGLRNKYIELKAREEIGEIKYYVSTTYFIFLLLVIVIIAIFLVINQFINWSTLLNAPSNYEEEIGSTVLIIFISLCLTFILKIIRTLLQADLRTGLSDGLGVISNIINLVGVFILINTTSSSLVYFAILYTGSNLLVLIAASIILFKTTYKSIRPGLNYIRMNLWKSLGSVGIKFFLLQIGSLILFQTTGLILSNLIGPEVVADYMITLRYFSVTTIVFIILAQPLWTGYGEAYIKNEKDWILNTFKRLKKLWFLLFIVLIMMLFLQQWIYDIWLKGKIEVNYPLSILFVLFYSLQMWASIYEPFINATSKLKLSLIILSFLIPLFIPFTIFLVKYAELGPAGVLIALIVLNGIPMTILLTIQSNKILKNSQGIWNK